MTPSEYEALVRHFDRLCDAGDAERAEAIAALRRDDPAIAERLVAMLSGDAAGSSPIERAVRDASAPTATDEPGDEMLAPGDLVADRYRVAERLGAGGGGRVFRAVDTNDGATVALKLLNPELAANRSALRRFEREFRALEGLDHPNCLRVLAQGREAGRPFIVMDYAAGGDLTRLVGADVATLLPILAQVVAGLDYVHSRRIVHRDLKPANVLLSDTEPPLAMLSDFGIAQVQDDESTTLTRSGALLGTIDFLSPEQVRGEPLDPRSDLYALGCLVYFLVTGRPPFAGSPLQRMVARLDTTPGRLRDLVPAVPPALCDLTRELLAPSPADRPQSAIDVTHALAPLLAEAGIEAADAGPQRGTRGAFLYEPGCIGRSEILATLVAGPPSPGRGPTAIVAEAGLGKSLLMREAAQTLRRRGVETLVFRFRPEDAGPLGPFPAIARELHADAAALDDGDEPPVALPGRDLVEAGAFGLRRGAQRLAAALRMSAEARPLLLVLEDVHHAKPGALRFLRALLDALAGQARPEEPPAAPGLRLWLTLRPKGRPALAELGDIELHTLAPLDADGVARVAAGMLAVSTSALPAGLLSLLVAESGGNPLLLRSDIRALVDGGWLRRVPGGWDFEPPAPGSDFLSSEIIRRRLSRLPGRTQRALERASVFGGGFASHLVASAFELEEHQVARDLDEAVRAEVVRPLSDEGADSYRFAHDRYVEALYTGLPEARRREWHGRVGAALLRLGAGDPAQVAYHLARGDDAALAHPHLLAAGDEAQRVYDHEAALRFYEEAAERIDALPDSERAAARVRCDEAIADMLVVLGRAPEASARYAGLLASGPREPLQRARWMRKQGLARLRTEDVAGAIGLLQGALVELGERVPGSRLAKLARFGLELARAALRRALRLSPRWSARDEERALLHRELTLLHRWIDMEGGTWHLGTFVRLAERLGRPTLVVDAHATLAVFYAFIAVPGRAHRSLRRAQDVALAGADEAGLARIETLRSAVALLLSDDQERAREHVAKGIRHAESVGDRFLIVFSLTARAWCDNIFGHFAEARRWFERAREVAVDIGSGWLRGDADVGRSIAELAAGELERAEETARGVLRSEASLALPALQAVATEALGCRAFLTYRFREAVGYLGEAQRMYRSHHLDRGWGFLVHSEHTEALLCLTEVEGPNAVPDLIPQLRRNRRRAARRMGRIPMYSGCLLVHEGVIASRSGRPEKALRLLEKALAVRPSPRSSYIDIWIVFRVAVERLRLGVPVSEVRPLFDEVERLCEVCDAQGWFPLIEQMRGRLGVPRLLSPD